MRIEDLKTGDSIHVQRLNRASQHYKNLYNDTKGTVIRNLSATQVSQLTQNTVNQPGVLVKLTPNPAVPIRHGVFGTAAVFGENEFLITNLDIFVKL